MPSCCASRKLGEARKLIMKGCELCPGSEDVWLEAARLQTPDHAKALLARGVAANPTSIKLWMQARTARAHPLHLPSCAPAHPAPAPCPWWLRWEARAAAHAPHARAAWTLLHLGIACTPV